MCLVSLIQQTELMISAVPDFFYERSLRKCNRTKPAPLMITIGNFRIDRLKSSLSV